MDDMDFDNLKNELGAKEVWMVSAKTGYNVEESMRSLDATVTCFYTTI